MPPFPGGRWRGGYYLSGLAFVLRRNNSFSGDVGRRTKKCLATRNAANCQVDGMQSPSSSFLRGKRGRETMTTPGSGKPCSIWGFHQMLAAIQVVTKKADLVFLRSTSLFFFAFYAVMVLNRSWSGTSLLLGSSIRYENEFELLYSWPCIHTLTVYLISC